MAARKAKVKDDGIYWVVSQRRLMTWTPVLVAKDRDSAVDAQRMLEADDPSRYNKYKIDRVELLNF